MKTTDSSPLDSCATCVFWRRDLAGERGADWGQCRRMPPLLPEDRDDKLVVVGVWPHTEAGDWCGEWRGHRGDDTPPGRVAG